MNDKNEKPVKPKIGLFIHGLIPQYNRLAWLGLAEASLAANMHLISYVVGESSYTTNPQNALFEFVHSEMLDGIVFLQALGLEFLASDESPDWLTRLEQVQVPMMRIGLPFAYGPSIVIDNYSATRQLMEHLIVVHGCEHIAFVSGFVDHLDTQIRYEVYLEKLREHGLPVLPELVAEGDYTRASGAKAIQTILEAYSGDVHAVFAANDAMALGSIDVLQERGYHVPKDILVVGFDDVIEGRYIRYPLTTVRQPIYEMGKMAISMMSDLLQGKPCAAETVLPTELLIRQSCGCLPQSVVWAGADTAVSTLTAYPPELSANWTQRLEKSYLADLQSAQTTEFLSTLSDLMEQATNVPLESTQWQNFITQLRGQFQHENNSKRAENLWHQARVLLSDANYRGQAALSTAKTLKAIDLSQIIQRISRSFDFEQFQRAFVTELPGAGVYKCLLTIHPNADVIADRRANLLPRLTQPLVYFDQEQAQFFSEGAAHIDSHHLLTHILAEDKPELSIVQMLFQHNQPIGYLVLFVPATIENIYVYELLKSQISNVLLGTLLMKQIQAHAVELETEVAKRTVNLQEANAQLQRSAMELEQSNRELKVVANVAAHDLQEPLRKIQLFADRLDALYQNVLDERGLDYLRRLQSSSARMQRLIHDLRIFSHVTTRKLAIEEVDLAHTMRSVLIELESMYAGCSAQVHTEKLPTLEADPYQMMLLFSNLISNGLKFQDGDNVPQVSIQAELLGLPTRLVRIRFQDNGIGMDMKYHDRIFDAFQKLHGRNEFRGSGIGLAICRRIVERHNGTITMQSKEGQGTLFTVDLPLKQS